MYTYTYPGYHILTEHITIEFPIGAFDRIRHVGNHYRSIPPDKLLFTVQTVVQIVHSTRVVCGIILRNGDVLLLGVGEVLQLGHFTPMFLCVANEIHVKGVTADKRDADEHHEHHSLVDSHISNHIKNLIILHCTRQVKRNVDKQTGLV